MKTGRIRKKEQPTPQEPVPQESATEAPAPAPKPAPKPSRPKSTTKTTQPRPAGTTPKKYKPPYLVFIGLGAIAACFILWYLSG